MPKNKKAPITKEPSVPKPEPKQQYVVMSTFHFGRTWYKDGMIFEFDPAGLEFLQARGLTEQQELDALVARRLIAPLKG